MADTLDNSVLKSTEGNEDESIITMVDVLEEEKKLEEDAFAVLGASDDKNCTYSQGYVKRQALYACKTCYQTNHKLAGICLACSYHCHEGHDLVELYTKRNFRCDCGNSLFGDKSCNLEPNKEDSNKDNKYNQNFHGVYCTCGRPYPDPDDNTLDEMIQCIVCEDWYHTRHLNGSTVPPAGDSYSEMMCNSCSDKLPFLNHYGGYSVSVIKNETSEGDSIKDVDIDDKKTTVNKISVPNSDNKSDVDSSSKGAGDSDKELKDVKLEVNDISTTASLNSVTVTVPNNSVDTAIENKVCTDKKLDIPPIIDGDSNQGCKLKLSVNLSLLEKGKASFWREGFRNILCKCDACMELYSKYDVSFLIDPNDTVQAYEEEGKTRRNVNRAESESGYEEGLKALSTLDRVKQVEAIHGYYEMQEHLKAYLAKFAENKKVVRAEDIKEFFSEMQSRKRQKVEIPYFCH